MFKRITAILAGTLLVLVGLMVGPASAGPHQEGATLGNWTTTQSCGPSTFTYNYDTTQMAGSQRQLMLQWAEKTGPALSNWAPMVNGQQGGALDKSLSGRGVYQQLGAVASGTVRITKGTPQASNWSRVIFSYASTDTTGRLLKTTTNLCTTGTFDFTDNVLPPPPLDISGTDFSMDFSCMSSINTAYASHWTWYYEISGTNPNWTVTTTGLVRNSETGTPISVDLAFGSSTHIVNPSTATFTWASGPLPLAYFTADWGSSIICTDDETLIVGP
jgi:hypothetical protein